VTCRLPLPENRSDATFRCPQSEIIRLKQVDHIMSEKAILQAINHPMIITLYGTSQDDLHLYMYMEFVSGGELFSHLRRAGRFTNDTGKFFAASIILAMQHLHGTRSFNLQPFTKAAGAAQRAPLFSSSQQLTCCYYCSAQRWTLCTVT
jgi:serine/threonine protein kinase